jgi:RNA polymerase sigma-70 factor (ECF subfamily)
VKTSQPFRGVPGLQVRLQVKPAAPADDLVLKQAQAGDEKAFSALYEHHRTRVYRICLRMVKNEALAEDMTQETFLQVFRKLRTFRQESAFTTWLYRVAANTVFMYLRKKRPPLVSLEEVQQLEMEEQPLVHELGAEDPRLRSCLDRVMLQTALRKLSRGYRMVLSLHDIMGYRHPEIARKLNCSVGNSKSQLHKARLRLRSSLPAEQHNLREKLAA